MKKDLIEVDTKDKKKESPLDKLRKDFEQVKSKETHRVVRLKVSLQCGCGNSDLEIERTVPFDSKLKNGDSIRESEVTGEDRIL